MQSGPILWAYDQDGNRVHAADAKDGASYYLLDGTRVHPWKPRSLHTRRGAHYQHYPVAGDKRKAVGLKTRVRVLDKAALFEAIFTPPVPPAGHGPGGPGEGGIDGGEEQGGGQSNAIAFTPCRSLRQIYAMELHTKDWDGYKAYADIVIFEQWYSKCLYNFCGGQLVVEAIPHKLFRKTREIRFSCEWTWADVQRHRFFTLTFDDNRTFERVYQYLQYQQYETADHTLAYGFRTQRVLVAGDWIRHDTYPNYFVAKCVSHGQIFVLPNN